MYLRRANPRQCMRRCTRHPLYSLVWSWETSWLLERWVFSGENRMLKILVFYLKDIQSLQTNISCLNLCVKYKITTLYSFKWQLFQNRKKKNSFCIRNAFNRKDIFWQLYIVELWWQKQLKVGSRRVFVAFYALFQIIQWHLLLR